MHGEKVFKNSDKKIKDGRLTLLGNFLYDAGSNGCPHVSDGEAAKLWKVLVGFDGYRVQRLHFYPSSVACFQEAGVLFDNLPSPRINLLQ